MKHRSDNEYKLVSDDSFQLVEAYKILRTNVEYSIINGDSKVIIVTSSVAQEGKSHVTANLGVFLSQNGYNVLLMDCDFRKPKLHKFFKPSDATGISNVIFKKRDLTYVIKEVNPHLHALYTGPLPPNSVEILGSWQMKDLIRSVSDMFDYILIDTPPSAYLSDACVLAPNASGVLFVIKYSSTPIDIINKAITNLKKVNANIIGTVITQVITRKFAGYNKYMHVDHYVDHGKKKHRK